MRQTAERFLDYACSLQLPSDGSGRLVCCDADWERIGERDVLFVVFQGEEPLTWGCSEWSFEDVAHGIDAENSEAVRNACFEIASHNGLIDVFVAKRRSEGYERFMEYLSSLR